MIVASILVSLIFCCAALPGSLGCDDTDGTDLRQPSGNEGGSQKYRFHGFSLTAKSAFASFDVKVHQRNGDQGLLCYRHNGGGTSVTKDCDKKLDGIYMQFHPIGQKKLSDVCRFEVVGAPQETSEPEQCNYGKNPDGSCRSTAPNYLAIDQSTTAYIGWAHYAIDGKADPNYFQRSCTHTQENSYRPWWYVSLGGPRTVTSVLIFNRGDCCANRLSNFDIAVVDTVPDRSCTSPGARGCRDYAREGSLCLHQGADYVSGKWKTYTCQKPVPGRYLVIQLSGTNIPLTLCEVQATCSGVNGNCIPKFGDLCSYGKYPDGSCRSSAPNYPKIDQSTTAYDGWPRYAVDGKADPNYFQRSCTHTQEKTHRPWWYVSLGGPKTVTSVHIFNRGDCCANRLSNFDIAVVDTVPDRSCTSAGSSGCRDYAREGSLCLHQGADYVSGKWKTFTCQTPVTGRYLVIQLSGTNIPLTLCEVQATCSGVNGNCIPNN